MIPTHIRRTRACACATALRAAPLAALAAPALPTAAQVTAGAATVHSTGTSMTITQSTPDVAINWQNFSIGAGDAVRIIQQTQTPRRAVEGLWRDYR